MLVVMRLGAGMVVVVVRSLFCAHVYDKFKAVSYCTSLATFVMRTMRKAV
jgi:hypothetical protein